MCLHLSWRAAASLGPSQAACASFVLHTFSVLCFAGSSKPNLFNLCFSLPVFGPPAPRKTVQDGAGPTHHPPLHRADAEDNKLVSLRMRTARLLAFASLRLPDAFATVTPDKKDLNQVQELLAVRTKHEMRLHGVCDVVVKAQAAKQE